MEEQTGDQIIKWFKCYLTNHYQKVASITVPLIYCLSFLVYHRTAYSALFGFLVYINDMPEYICHSLLLIFADDTKCLKHIHTITDHNIVQEDINSLFTSCRDSDLNFNLKNCAYLSFKHNVDTTYTLSDIIIPYNMCHKDLGVILSSDLSWNNHYKSITARVYKVLGPISHTILPNHSTTIMVKLYVSLLNRSYSTELKSGVHI